jgi:Na+-transporting NADH:ubiquinone oxidoreductase subunit NqrA
MFTAPSPGTVVATNRGERRVLQSLVIRVEGNEQREFPSTRQISPVWTASPARRRFHSGLLVAV